MRLQLGDVADRAQRGAADLAHALGDLVGDGENLLALLVEQQMIVAEMRAADMPMEVLGLEIERENVGEDLVELGGQFPDGSRWKIGRRIKCRRRLVARIEGSDFAHGGHLTDWMDGTERCRLSRRHRQAQGL